MRPVAACSAARLEDWSQSRASPAGRRFGQHHHVERIATAHRIGHRVQPGPEPDRDLRAAQGRRQGRLVDQRAPRRVAGGARRRILQHERPHRAPEAIGADQGIALPGAALGAGHADRMVARDHAGDPRRGGQRDGPGAARRRQQQRVQVGAIDAEIGRRRSCAASRCPAAGGRFRGRRWRREPPAHRAAPRSAPAAPRRPAAAAGASRWGRAGCRRRPRRRPPPARAGRPGGGGRASASALARPAMPPPAIRTWAGMERTQRGARGSGLAPGFGLRAGAAAAAAAVAGPAARRLAEGSRQLLRPLASTRPARCVPAATLPAAARRQPAGIQRHSA